MCRKYTLFIISFFIFNMGHQVQAFTLKSLASELGVNFETEIETPFLDFFAKQKLDNINLYLNTLVKTYNALSSSGPLNSSLYPQLKNICTTSNSCDIILKKAVEELDFSDKTPGFDDRKAKGEINYKGLDNAFLMAQPMVYTIFVMSGKGAINSFVTAFLQRLPYQSQIHFDLATFFFYGSRIFPNYDFIVAKNNLTLLQKMDYYRSLNSVVIALSQILVKPWLADIKPIEGYYASIWSMMAETQGGEGIPKVFPHKIAIDYIVRATEIFNLLADESNRGLLQKLFFSDQNLSHTEMVNQFIQGQYKIYPARLSVGLFKTFMALYPIMDFHFGNIESATQLLKIIKLADFITMGSVLSGQMQNSYFAALEKKIKTVPEYKNMIDPLYMLTDQEVNTLKAMAQLAANYWSQIGDSRILALINILAPNGQARQVPATFDLPNDAATLGQLLIAAERLRTQQYDTSFTMTSSDFKQLYHRIKNIYPELDTMVGL